MRRDLHSKNKKASQLGSSIREAAELVHFQEETDKVSFIRREREAFSWFVLRWSFCAFTILDRRVYDNDIICFSSRRVNLALAYTELTEELGRLQALSSKQTEILRKASQEQASPGKHLQQTGGAREH